VLLALAAATLGACSAADDAAKDGAGAHDDPASPRMREGAPRDPNATGLPSSGAPGAGGTGGDETGGTSDPALPSAPLRASVKVRLVPNQSGPSRVNFAVPFGKGWLRDERLVRVTIAGAEPAAVGTRVLARHADGSIRSLQLQFDSDVRAPVETDVALGTPRSARALDLVPVASTLVPKGQASIPRVWAVLPADWLADTAATGPTLPEAATTGPAAAYRRVCDYGRHNADAFERLQTDSSVWLYDRPTTLYRGYARRGDLATLESAYREADIYRSGIRGAGAQTTIGLSDKADDLKYHYTQGLALHYLLSGDDRFREAAENIAERIASLWPRPEYSGGARFWTERHAGFALLGYVWAQIVSDDRAPRFAKLADDAVAAYVRAQNAIPSGYTDAAARCFAHEAEAHGEPYGYMGCSPWMSAILADGLESYALAREGAQAEQARSAIVKLGRILARSGRDKATGRPFYWMGVGVTQNEPDAYDEHWGESAYVIAMAWHYSGRKDDAMRTAATDLMNGLGRYGTAPHMRSFNWQCRSAVAAAHYIK
jgi:hypothetical protein